MSKISITYPASGLTPTISVVNKATGVVVSSGAMEEVGTTKSYWYEFADTPNTDYVFTISEDGYDDVVDTLISDARLDNLDAPISSRATPTDLSFQLVAPTNAKKPISIII